MDTGALLMRHKDANLPLTKKWGAGRDWETQGDKRETRHLASDRETQGDKRDTTPQPASQHLASDRRDWETQGEGEKRDPATSVTASGL